MYWMALAAIPAIVLTKLRKIIYNFLWSRCVVSSRQHLCNWQTLAKPKHKGGWELRNLHHFNQALAISTLLRVLTSSGIWHSIIIDKYIRHHSVNSWLIYEPAHTRATMETSYFWRNLIKSKHLISRWLCWLPRSGISIELGRDRILSLGDHSILPPSWYLTSIRTMCDSYIKPESAPARPTHQTVGSRAIPSVSA
jgi:hypothetical protein